MLFVRFSAVWIRLKHLQDTKTKGNERIDPVVIIRGTPLAVHPACSLRGRPRLLVLQADHQRTFVRTASSQRFGNELYNFTTGVSLLSVTV